MIKVGIGPRDYGSMYCFDGIWEAEAFRFVPCAHATIRPLAKLIPPFRKISDSFVLFGNVPDEVHFVHTFNLIPLNNIHWVTSFESILPRMWEWPHWRNRLLKRIVDDHCLGLFAISENAKFHVLNRNQRFFSLSGMDQKISVVYPGIPDVAFSVEEKKQQRHADLKVLFVGNEFFRKGGHIAVDAIIEAKKKSASIDAVVVSTMRESNYIYSVSKGEGKKYMAKMDQNGIAHLSQLDKQSVQELMAWADVILLPTLDDSFGYTVVEGMRCKAVPIASAVRAIPEMFEHEKSGFQLTVPVNEEGRIIYSTEVGHQMTQDLVEILTALAASPNRLKAMAALGRNIYEKKFSQKVLEQNLSQVYGLLQGRL